MSNVLKVNNIDPDAQGNVNTVSDARQDRAALDKSKSCNAFTTSMDIINATLVKKATKTEVLVLEQCIADMKGIAKFNDPAAITLKDAKAAIDANSDKTDIPKGGTTGQALVKKSDADGDVEWENATGGISNILPGSDNVHITIDAGVATLTVDKTSDFFYEVDHHISCNKSIYLNEDFAPIAFQEYNPYNGVFSHGFIDVAGHGKVAKGWEFIDYVGSITGSVRISTLDHHDIQKISIGDGSKVTVKIPWIDNETQKPFTLVKGSRCFISTHLKAGDLRISSIRLGNSYADSKILGEDVEAYRTNYKNVEFDFIWDKATTTSANLYITKDETDGTGCTIEIGDVKNWHDGADRRPGNMSGTAGSFGRLLVEQNELIIDTNNDGAPFVYDKTAKIITNKAVVPPTPPKAATVFSPINLEDGNYYSDQTMYIPANGDEMSTGTEHVLLVANTDYESPYFKVHSVIPVGAKSVVLHTTCVSPKYPIGTTELSLRVNIRKNDGSTTYNDAIAPFKTNPTTEKMECTKHEYTFNPDDLNKDTITWMSVELQSYNLGKWFTLEIYGLVLEYKF